MDFSFAAPADNRNTIPKLDTLFPTRRCSERTETRVLIGLDGAGKTVIASGTDGLCDQIIQRWLCLWIL